RGRADDRGDCALPAVHTRRTRRRRGIRVRRAHPERRAAEDRGTLPRPASQRAGARGRRVGHLTHGPTSHHHADAASGGVTVHPPPATAAGSASTGHGASAISARVVLPATALV